MVLGFFKSKKPVKKRIPTLEEENEKRISIGYPHMINLVKERCPTCNGQMVHDEFEKLIDFKDHHIKALYKCIKCREERLFDLVTNKLEKELWPRN